ncbi:MAG: hypothetical protein LH478_00315 [Chitinophagaceae bacterium]|nr:hypothetical protein [Chitinophagaceae bacterium]
MKKVVISASLIILVIAGMSCKKIKDAIFPSIDVDLPAFQFTIPAIPLVLSNEVSLGSFAVNFNLDSIIRANTAGAFGAGAVSTVKVKKMVITVSNGDAANNLANFESARFTFSSNTKTTPAEITLITFPDTFATTYTAQPADSPELKEYLSGNTLTYNLYGKSRRTTTKPLDFRVAVTLSAK